MMATRMRYCNRCPSLFAKLRQTILHASQSAPDIVLRHASSRYKQAEPEEPKKQPTPDEGTVSRHGSHTEGPSLIEIIPPRLPVAASEQLRTRQGRLRVCEALYYELFAFHKHKMPARGMLLNIVYLDTGVPRVVEDYADRHGIIMPFPTVVMLPDSPGSHEDCSATAELLSQCGARVIVPNFPGFGYTSMDKDNRFRHSIVERTSFVYDFLRAIRVNRVDLLVAFGTGSTVALPLITTLSLPIRSLCLVNPTPMCRFRAIRQHWYWQALRMRHNRRFFRSFTVRRMRSLLSNVVDKETLAAFWFDTAAAGTVLTYADLQLLPYHRSIQDLPFVLQDLLFLMSDDDLVADKSAYMKTADALNVPPSRLGRIDQDGRIVRGGVPIITNKKFAKGLTFTNGGHYPYKKFPKAFQSLVLELYSHVCRKHGMKVRVTV